MLPEHVHPDFALTNTGQTPNSIHTIWPITPPRGTPETRKTTRHQVVLEVARAGIEPATFRFSGGRSYQLSYLAGRHPVSRVLSPHYCDPDGT